MRFFKNSVSFLAIMCVCGAAYSAARVATVGSVATANRRLASLSNVVKSTNTAAATTGTASSSSASNPLLSDAECIEEYRSCMKSDNACGSDFEECTTNVLFHGHMGECFSTLYQCSSSAITSLFGVSSISSLSSISSYVEGTVKKDSNGKIIDGEVDRYTYPTDGSIMGIDIIGAQTRNKLSTADCVKKYKNCLTKDNVCGEDFELCTSEDEFKKQAVMCDSTLSRCQKEGFQQLFGEKVMTKPANNKLKPADGDTYKWMTDGATLAAANAVNTCYKVIDSCFVNACAKNPYRCVEGVTFGVLGTADFVADQTKSSTIDEANVTETQTASSVRKFYRAACQDTIGSNQYCYMTFKAKTPSKKDLTDPDTREEIFDEAYSTRNKKDIIGVKVTDMVEKFDKNAKDKCIETFKTCAIRSCGGGSGAACYSRVFGSKAAKDGRNLKGTINKGTPYLDIVRGCTAAVNTDANCKYMAATLSEKNNTYNYTYSDDGAFNALFPEYTNEGDDKFPVVAALNADLSTAYNDAAIAQLKKQCSNVVANCVKSMCGSDYQNCYRNRTDISVAVYNSGNDKFNRSMNKVGGVLDYTIVQGLCASTVKNADICAESLAIAKAGVKDSTSVTTGWGDETNIGSAWRTSAQNGYSADGAQVVDTDDQGREMCRCNNGGTSICSHEDGGTKDCDERIMVSSEVKIDKTAVTNLFQDVLADVEAEAQAMYKAKLTKEQNICIAQNSSANPNATFVWAKLKNKKKVDTGYAINGLGEDGWMQSNDLYNSFCRVKVTMMSDDRDVQSVFTSNNPNAYFSTGDAFTCGSWLSKDMLDSITSKVTEDAQKEAGKDSIKDKNTKTLLTAASALLGGGAAAFGYDKLQTSDSFGGLLNKNYANSQKGEQCNDLVSQARSKYDAAVRNKSQKDMDEAVRMANQAKAKLSSIDSNKANGITIPSYIALQTYNTNELERAGSAAVAGQDAVFSLDPDVVQAISGSNGVIGRAETLCNYTDPDINKNDYPVCRDAVIAANDRMKAITVPYTAETTVDISDVKTSLNTAIAKLKVLHKKGQGTGTHRYDKDADYKRQVDALEADVNALASTIRVIKTQDAVAARAAVEAVYKQAQKWDEEELNTLNKAFALLEENCDTVASGKNGAGLRLGTDIAVGVVGAVGTGFLVNKIVDQAQQSKYETAGNEAVKEWMENIGSKIHCYVGGEKVGSFGDIVSIDISED